MKTADTDYVYILYKIPDSVSSVIRHTISQMSGYHYHYFQLEGKPLPDFHFTDLNGKVYDRETCKGKIVVINSWFIGCHACRQEMPALNKLVDSLRNHNNILFVSLAYDSPDQLKSFLTKTKFNYAIVPNMETYLIDTLGIQISPTHFIINRKGIVVNITNDYHQMEDALKREIGHLAHNYKK
jgi:peroxiredoxin